MRKIHDDHLLTTSIQRPSMGERTALLYDRMFAVLSPNAQRRWMFFILGLKTFWGFSRIAFWDAITPKEMLEIRRSPTLRGLIVIAALISGLVLVHCLKHDWPWLDSIFLLIQAARLVMFFGALKLEGEELPK